MAHKARHRHAALQPEGRVDQIDFEEDFRKVVLFHGPHVVDGLPNRPEYRRRHEGALHQAAGGFLVEGQRAFDGRAVGRRDLGENARLPVFLEIVQKEGRVVRIQMPDHRRHGGVGQFVQRIETRRVREFGYRFGRQILAQQVDRLAEGFRRQVFEKVGGVGGVKLLHRAPQQRLVAIADRPDELGDHRGIYSPGAFGMFCGSVRFWRVVGVAGVIHCDLPTR